MSSVRLRAPRRVLRPLLVAVAALSLAATGLLLVPGALPGDQRGENDRAVLASSPVTLSLNKVAAGGEHSCGIGSRYLHCWGRNTWGQLGNGGRGPAVEEPVRVGARGWRQVAAGGATTCGIRGNKRVLKCWGLNHYGQLGDGTTTWTSTPTGLARKKRHWKRVDTGWYHTCGVRKNKRLFCWGDNTHGQLGLGDRRMRTKPTRLPGRWRKVAVEGWTTCAVKKNRSLHCWGRNLLGQVGDGTMVDRSRPVKVAGPAWRRVDVSWTHACAIHRNRSTWCWGNNDRGQLGDRTTDRRLRPTQVVGGIEARDLGTAELSTCLTTIADRLYCWGDDRYQQVGGDRSSYARPQLLSGNYRKLGAGWMHNCAVRPGGGVDCWGADDQAQVRPATHRTVQRASSTSETDASVETVAHEAAADGPLTFKMATYNVLGEHHTSPYRAEDRFAPTTLRSEWTMQAFRTHELDIVGIQESSQTQVAELLKAGEGRYEAFPHPFQDNKNTETTILWDTGKFKAVEKRVVWTQFIARKYPRPYIKFEDRDTGRQFWVMNIHNAPWDYQKKRDAATKVQIEKIQKLETQGLPVYYIGDFNEWKRILCKVLRNTGLNSPLGGRLKKSGECVAPNRRMRVDWIFGSRYTDWNNYSVVKYPVIRLTTDHWVHFVDVAVP